MSRNLSPDPIDIHVGKRMRVRRKQINISQETLAASLELTFQQVQKYERGANRVSASKLYKIAQTLEVPVEYFFEGLPNSPNGTVDRTFESEAMEVVLAMPSIRKVVNLPRAQQVALETLIAGVVKLHAPGANANK